MTATPPCCASAMPLTTSWRVKFSSRSLLPLWFRKNHRTEMFGKLILDRTAMHWHTSFLAARWYCQPLRMYHPVNITMNENMTKYTKRHKTWEEVDVGCKRIPSLFNHVPNGMFPKIMGFPPKSSIFNRVFHYNSSIFTIWVFPKIKVPPNGWFIIHGKPY